jgi:hypothetical protein
LGTPGHPGGIECLFDKKYRESTWMCLCLSFFNVMSGVTTLLIYLSLIFDEADKGKEVYTLNAKQMASGLAFGLTAGAGTATKMVSKFKRRELFCLSHFMIGISLCIAGACLQHKNGLSTFFFIWCAQFWL